MKSNTVSNQKAYQFIVLPYTGLQICRGFPTYIKEEKEIEKIWNLGKKIAARHAQDEAVQILCKHIAVNCEVDATGWIPCSHEEDVFFRITRTATSLLLDLLIDTRHGAGKQYKNKIPCLLEEKRFGLMRTSYTLATIFIEEHGEASGKRGTLLIDYGNSAITSIFYPTGGKTFENTVIPVNEPFDPNYKTRAVEGKRLLRSNVCLLRVPTNPDYEPWVVLGEPAADLIIKEPLCTYLFAPKKYVRHWPERLKAQEPSTTYRGVMGQRDGLHPMFRFVELGIKQLLESLISTLVNPSETSLSPEMYPLIERITLTYPQTWRECDREKFCETFRKIAQEYIYVDKKLIGEIPIEMICSEPVAVAAYLLWESIFYYGPDALKLMSSTLGNVDGEETLRILVLDIGGGSSDIAVVQVNWEVTNANDIDVRFRMIEAMRFNRAGDRLNHILVTALLDYFRKKYEIEESLDFEAEPNNLAFTISEKRTAITKLNELAEQAKVHLSQSEQPWLLEQSEEESLLAQGFRPLVKKETTADHLPFFELDRKTFAEWIRRDTQAIETNGEPGFMDIFLFLRDLGQTLKANGRPPHLAVLSGRTTRLPIIQKLAVEALDMPYHRVRTLQQLLPLTIHRPGHENPDKISVVAGAHRFRFGDNIRFIPLPGEKVFNRHIGSVRETPDGLKLNQVFANPGDSIPISVTSLKIAPLKDLRIGHSFRKDGLAQVIAVLSNPTTDEKEVSIDLLDDFTVKLNHGDEVTLAEWIPGGNDIIADNFFDTGKIDANPKDFIARTIVRDFNTVTRSGVEI
ncbi:MAG: hypothetical protein C4527_11540 [Candidatus Omnitrophota bacterium]|jgi:hypothetical protein|nr:MAG: hypothetical protein C4527_11540 [Candidatus Omnitrophota bacterium]